MDRLNNPFYITYLDGSEIDFNSEGIGFIPSIKIKDIPVFFKNVINESEMSYEYSGFCFGPITELDKVWLEDGYVEVWVLDNKTILTKYDFFELALQLANKALEAVDIFDLKATTSINYEWIIKIKESILLLESKIKNIL